MSEVPPPTRRARKDAPATVGAPPAGEAQPEAPVLPGPSGTTPAIPGSAAAAAASFAAGSGGAGTPGGARAQGAGMPGGVETPAGAGTPTGGGTPVSAGMPITDASAPSPHLDDDPERMATAQLEMAAFGDHLIPYVPPQPPVPRSMAPWALALAILALSASLFTGWLLLLGVGGVIVASTSLRRPHDNRRPAGWALSLAVLSLVFSAGWLIWGFSQLAVV